jgi:RHH-type transcriptional regulator, proline utilization regulon repressor / proline dehydrogenase / delta 1-pyrroline-5-carboxylate dehydrogenase
VGVAFTMRFVDRVARHRSDRLAAEQLAALVSDEHLPGFLGPINRTMLRAGALMGRWLPGIVMPLARRRLRAIVGHLVVDAEPAALHRHLSAQRGEDFDLNINLLGEMVLGEGEAARRLDATLALVDDPQIDYVSVKISGIASHLDLWSYEHTLERVTDRLRTLLRRAATSSPVTFVNLDMEEYRDLELTIAAFTRVLDESDLEHVEAGIVLQAYLPDALDALDRLTAWAQARRARGGAGIKIRLVKGANLAMERVDAELHGWPQAPYTSKAEVDGNYERCLDQALRPDRSAAVRIGVASHNLFDVAWAHLLTERRGVADRVEFEMLQGIAPGQARTVRDHTGGLLLYTPVVERADFDVAISYLFRRLEENASPENFLRHLFSLDPDGPEFRRLAAAFRGSVAARNTLPTTPRRSTPLPRPDDRFTNEPDSDPTLADTRTWIADIRTSEPSGLTAPITTDITTADQAIDRARRAQPAWWRSGAAERRSVLHRVADELALRRGELIVTMAHEARKLYSEADPEVSEAIDFARWYADHALELERLDHATFTPLGVIAVVPPWNFPVAIPAGGVLASLAAGNTVIFKPAPETPRCAEVVAEACWAAGVPRDVLQFVRTPDDDVGQRLVTGVDGVVFTGSWDTAAMFRSWKPDLALFAETSGKNALVITPHADHDLAATDLVRSAFGHSGQKCSAASLAILVGDLADDTRFLGKVLDAARSLHVGRPTDAGPTMGPVIAPPSGPLLDALTELGPGESWLLEPRRLDREGSLWTPGIKTGVAPGSAFHRIECFGPVLGIMRAADLDEALALQNAVDYGLTGGIHSLDEAEIEHWLERVEVGNAYVNRHITGAIVQRQPFGGWKRSVIGPGAKAGGPDQLLQLGRTDAAGPNDPVEFLAAAEASDEHWMATHYGIDRDRTGLGCEANVHRYRPRPDVWIRATADADAVLLERAVAAARRSGARVDISIDPEAAATLAERRLLDQIDAREEDDDRFAVSLAALRWGRVRLVGTAPAALAAAAAAAEVDLIDAPVTASGRLELRWYLREQSISRTLHRFGNVAASPRVDHP